MRLRQLALVAASASMALVLPLGAAAPAPARTITAAALSAQTALAAAGAGSGTPMRVVSTESAPGGGSVVRLQHTVDGVPVLGGESVVALGGGSRVLATAATRATVTPASMVPRVSAGRAAEVARAAAPGALDALVSDPALWVYDPALLDAPGPRRTALVWRVSVSSASDPTVNRMVLVDARSAKVLLSIEQAPRVDRWVCDNADDAAASAQCTTPARVEGSPASGASDVDSAYAFAGSTTAFLAAVLGRDGLDGRGQAALGGTLRSTVRFCPTGGGDCPYTNALWNGSQMVYGAGYASAQDVVAHELVHGVTQFTSGLFYYHQSGAISESISDVLGELADQWSHVSAPGVTDTDTRAVRWEIGEDLPDGPIRSLAHPDVDRMSSPAFVRSEDDLGGVHANSGVGSKFAVLLTDGGTFNGRTVRGVGLVKTAQIIYTASRLLTSAADYRSYARALAAGCRSLVGTRLTTAGGLITSGDCAQVDLAAAAVEMTRSVTPAPVGLCPAGRTATALYRDGFESGAGGWVSGGLRDWYHSSAANPYAFTARYASSGRGNLWGNNGNRRGSSTMAMRRDVPLPVRTGTRYVVRFSHAYGFWPSDASTAADGGVVEYSTDHGRTWTRVTPSRWSRTGGANGYTGRLVRGTDNPLAGAVAFTGHSRGYLTSRFDVTDLAGTSLRLRFRVAQMGKPASDPGDAGWFVDDVSIQACR